MTEHTAKHFFDVPPELPHGTWQQKRKLAAVVRELNALCVTTEAPPEELAEIVALAEAIADRLKKQPGGTLLDAFVGGTVGDITRFADRSTLIGQSNPVAPPMTGMSDDGEVTTGWVTFGPPYEGAPGCVHGGLIAAVFDQTLGYMNVSRAVGSLTASLTVKYRKPTPLLKPLRLEARVDRVDGKKRWVSAKMFSGEEVTAEAEGLFIQIEAGKVKAIVDERLKD